MWVVIGILAGMLLGMVVMIIGGVVGAAISENAHTRDSRSRGEEPKFRDA